MFNTAKGRVKAKNLAREPRVALSIADPDNPYRYLGIQGRVVEMTETGGDAHIDKMAKKYLGQGQLSLPHAGRGPHHRQDRAGQGPHERLASPVDLHLFARARAFPRSTRGADLGALIAGAVARAGRGVERGDVFVVAQKIVSKAEGAIVRLDEVVPSAHGARSGRRANGKDPRVVEVILRESRRIVRMDRGMLIAETRHGFVCANAGVDASNVAPGFVTVLPDRSGCLGRTAARGAQRSRSAVPSR